jgi:hypothetical protein
MASDWLNRRALIGSDVGRLHGILLAVLSQNHKTLEILQKEFVYRVK